MLTKLDAVNIILDSIGESRVLSLEDSVSDARLALEKLEEVSKEVQGRGWHRNTERREILLDNAGKAVLPNNVLRVDSVGDSATINVVTRRDTNGFNYLFNLSDNKFVFDGPIEVEMVKEFDYEDLSLELQYYIAYRAARQFQETQMGSQALDTFTLRQEQDAFAALQMAEAELEDNNCLYNSATLVQMTRRYNRFY
jgi:hypothetical protein